jgi:CheY-like chemotaxis protein
MGKWSGPPKLIIVANDVSGRGKLGVITSRRHRSGTPVSLVRLQGSEPLSDMSQPEDPVRAVLLVEDEPLVRLFMAELLVDAGFRVVEAANADEALTVLNAGVDIHVLLADVDMPPGMNGYELAQAVHGHWPAVEILMTSGRQWPADGDLPPGAAFLAKPCPNDAIISHVRSAADRALASKRPEDLEEAAVDGGPKVIPFPKTA